VPVGGTGETLIIAAVDPVDIAKVSSIGMVIESVTALHQIEETNFIVIGFWTGISVAPSGVEAADILPRSSPSAGRSGSESDGAARHPRQRTCGGLAFLLDISHPE
jgi:hypothetical protein